MRPLIGRWVVLQPLLRGAVNMLLELSKPDHTVRRLNRDTHLVPVVCSREVKAMSGGPNGTAQNHAARSDVSGGDCHAPKYQLS